MRNILITGGAGFIGSHVFERLAAVFPDATITILDKMTYAADFDNISAGLKRHQRKLVVGDICDFELCTRLTRNVDCVVHMAAESHVDNSFGNSLPFTRSNALGTHAILEASRRNAVPMFLHLSTDEVYGEIDRGSFSEGSGLNPSNPYSGSKASAEMIVNSYRYSFGLPVIIVRANNVFGRRQFPEKIIPKFSMLCHLGKRMTIHGDGSNRRAYLAAEDLAEAMTMLLEKGGIGEVYNVGCEDEYCNSEIAAMICDVFGVEFDDAVAFVGDRPFNDSRYAIDCAKIRGLGWKPKRLLKDRLADVVNWYVENSDRYSDLFSNEAAGEFEAVEAVQQAKLAAGGGVAQATATPRPRQNLLVTDAVRDELGELVRRLGIAAERKAP